MLFFTSQMGLKGQEKTKKTNSIFYASVSVLINNHHIKVVDRIREGYKANGETQDRNSMVCIVPL